MIENKKDSYWAKAMNMRIGIIPLPVYILLGVLIVGLVINGKLKTEITVMIGVLAFGGFTCAELGKRIPILNKIGGPSLMNVFLPSYLVAINFFPADFVEPVTKFTKSSNFIYLFITAVVVGSILSMDRRVLLHGFIKIFIPLVSGSIVALFVGGFLGWLIGKGFLHSICYIVVPVMAGGVGEGAIPLAVGYADALGVEQGIMLGQILPVVFLGNLVAIICAGILNTLGRKKPHLTGNGRLQPAEDETVDEISARQRFHSDVSFVDASTVAAAGVMGATIYMLGTVIHMLFGLPAPVAMLFLVVIIKLAKMVPAKLEEGARVVFRFFVVGVTYPLLFSTAVAMTPWDRLVSAIHPANLVIIAGTVISLVATGYYVGKWVKMYPIDTAIVNSCHSGLGGTGDIMILTAAERMELMPFAQIATRIGGAITVTLAIIAMIHIQII